MEAVFTFWRTKRIIKSSVKCQSQIKPKTKQCADDELKKKLLERNLTPNLTPVFLSLRLLLVGFSLDVSSIIYAKNFRLDDSRATRFSSRRKRDATGNLLLSGTVFNNYYPKFCFKYCNFLVIYFYFLFLIDIYTFIS